MIKWDGRADGGSGGDFRTAGTRVRPRGERCLVGPQGRRYTRGGAADIDRRYHLTGPAVGCFCSIHGGI
ncbi:MAG: hypothetical protein ABSG04_13805, partial [Verrucomicrobiota bacterium]